MDDYNLNSLQESKNEWVSRLVNILTPYILEGFKSIFTESYKLCMENNEEDKYLMTFQNFISRIPRWNEDLIEKEVQRIQEKSNCSYIEDLITCVHVIQLKALTCIRVGQKQKKIELDIPKLKDFVHKVYINVARKIYTNIYLFELNIAPLQVQKNNRELELIIKECILETVRESIPVENILRSYLEESIEEEVIEPIPEVALIKENEEINPVLTETPMEESNNEMDFQNTETKNENKVEVPSLDLQINDLPKVEDNDLIKLKEDDRINIVKEESPSDLSFSDKVEINTIPANDPMEEINDSIKIYDENIEINVDSLENGNKEENLLDDIEILA
jgi:hypothetical protein